MRKISKEELAEVLEKHAKWLKNEKGGERADLRSAVLRSAEKTKPARVVKSSPITIENIGGEGGNLVAWPTNEGLILNRGCFTGTVEEFLKAVESKHSNSPHGESYRLAVKMLAESFAARGVSIDPDPVEEDKLEGGTE